jgi:UDP-2,3-diacylglucosamine pyrophosphatase LpxH
MPGRFKIVVSDLHLSAGRKAEGNPLEDFLSDAEFAAFLEETAAESDRDCSDVELIINGDAFEMLQVPHVEEFDPTFAYRPEQYHSSSEEDSARKMSIIIAGHRPFFDALGRFLRVGPPRRSVTFIKGNHDVNLHWTAVQDQIRQAMVATGGRTSLLTFEERCVSREGIYVEHGNQYAEAVDRLEDMEEPHDHDNPDQLAIPLGSWFVMDVFNIVERERYWIDGIKPLTALAWYALAYDFVFAARAIAALARALPGIITKRAFDAEPPSSALVQMLEDPAQVEKLAARYQDDETFRFQFNSEVVGLLAPRPNLPGVDMVPMASDPDPVSMGDQIRERVRSSLYEIAASRAVEERAKLVIFGHTHDASIENLPDGAVYANTGTWTWRADFSGADEQRWREIFEHPERFSDDRNLSYVRIDYDEAGQPVGQLLAYQPQPGLRAVGKQQTFAEKVPVPHANLFPLPPPASPPSLWGRILAWFRGWGTNSG